MIRHAHGSGTSKNPVMPALRRAQDEPGTCPGRDPEVDKLLNRDFPLGVPSGLFGCWWAIFGVFPVSSSRIASYSFVSQQKIHSKSSPTIIPNPDGKSRLKIQKDWIPARASARFILSPSKGRNDEICGFLEIARSECPFNGVFLIVLLESAHQ